MTYIGAEPDAAFTTTAKQTITGTGVATYTLDHAVSSESDIRVYVDNVHQEGGTGKAYTVDGNQITFTENITSSMDCYVIFSAMALQTTSIAADAIATGMIKDGAVTAAKIASGVISNDLPSGAVVKMTLLQSNTYKTTTSSSYTDGWSVSYTPVDAANTLYFNISTTLLREGSNRTDVRFQWRGSTCTGGEHLQAMDSHTTSGWAMFQCGFNCSATAGSGAGTFKIQHKNPDSGTSYLNYGSSHTSVLVYEVKA